MVNLPKKEVEMLTTSIQVGCEAEPWATDRHLTCFETHDAGQIHDYQNRRLRKLKHGISVTSEITSKYVLRKSVKLNLRLKYLS